MKSLTSIQIFTLLLLIASMAMASEPEVVVEYDEFTGIHSVALQEYTIKGAQRASIRGEGIWLRVAATYSTHEDHPEGAGLLGMFIYATDRRSTLERNYRLHLLIDGERLTIPNEGFYRRPPAVVTSESLGFPLTISELEKMSQAATIRARVGPRLEFEFPQALISGLKEMREKIETGFDGEQQIEQE